MLFFLSYKENFISHNNTFPCTFPTLTRTTTQSNCRSNFSAPYVYENLLSVVDYVCKIPSLQAHKMKAKSQIHIWSSLHHHQCQLNAFTTFLHLQYYAGFYLKTTTTNNANDILTNLFITYTYMPSYILSPCKQAFHSNIWQFDESSFLQ